MNLNLTLKGIDLAFDNLPYRNPNAPKYRLIQAIRKHYSTEEDLTRIHGIPTENLIAEIWETGEDAQAIRSRIKNFASLRTAINADLKKMMEEDKNPEGVIIGKNNTFEMDNSMREKLLQTVSGMVSGDNGQMSISRLYELINIVKDFLDRREKGVDDPDGKELQELKNLLESIDAPGTETPEPDTGAGEEDSGAEDESEPETIEMDEDEELQDTEEIEDDIETIEIDDDEELQDTEEIEDDIETIEIDDDEELQDAEEIDEDIETIELDEDEELQDAEEIDEEIETIEIDDDEELQDAEEIDEDIETIELDDDEELQDAEEIDEDIETIEMDEDEELQDAEEIDEDIETIELNDDEELQDAEEIDEDTETIELDDDEELQDAEEIDEDTETIEMDEDEELQDAEEIDEDTETIELDDDEEPGDSEGGDLVELGEDEELMDEDDEIPEIEDNDSAPLMDLLDDDEVEEVEVDGELDPDLFEELVEPEEEAPEEEEKEEAPDLGLSFGSDEDFSEYDPDDMEKNRLLSERFDGYLGAMERFYNQYPLVDQGSFRVGSPNPGKLERRETKIQLKDFYIGRFPVTNALFEVFVERTGYRTTAEKMGYGTVFQPRFRKVKDPDTGEMKAQWVAETGSKRIDGAAWYAPEGPGSSIHLKRNHPVVQISIEDARRFAAWIGKRLPTEDEWEAAARTAKGLPYPWGETWNPEASNVETTGIGETTAVDTFTKGQNDFSLMDLTGNVLEWTQSPMEGLSQNVSQIPFFIAKGGSFITAGEPTLWARYPLRPDFTANILGFRCLVD